MTVADEHRLLQRLARVEALHEGATTPGEREAAARARQRLIDRLVDIRRSDPIARFCREQVRAMGVPGAPHVPEDPIPDLRTVLGAIARWEAGDWEADELQDWAADRVDRVTLPPDPAHPMACVGEVVLQLAALHQIRFERRDVRRIRRFLRDGDWTAWFALLEEVAGRR